MQITIARSTPIVRTPRVVQIEGIFDIPPAQKSERRWEHHLDLPDDWHIGVIVGPSGSGKTTFAREAFGDKLVERWDWPSDKSILDGFPTSMSIRDIVELLCSVGFSSPPAWVRPFVALSNGEQFRVNLARTLAESSGSVAVVDEFTSVVDRTVAKIGSAAVAKAVRRRGQKFIAVTCHYDVIEWLEPDWVYQPHLGTLERGLVRRRPEIRLEISRTTAAAWRIFRQHHYLSGDLHPSAACFMAVVNDRAVAFVAVLPFPHPTHPGWREHRCVCLPDFQGVGIGHALSEFVASLYAAGRKPYRSTTSHPGMIAHRRRSPLWRMTRRPSPGVRQRGLESAGSFGRLVASFRYVGPKRGDDARKFGVKLS